MPRKGSTPGLKTTTSFARAKMRSMRKLTRGVSRLAERLTAPKRMESLWACRVNPIGTIVRFVSNQIFFTATMRVVNNLNFVMHWCARVAGLSSSASANSERFEQVLSSARTGAALSILIAILRRDASETAARIQERVVTSIPTARFKAGVSSIVAADIKQKKRRELRTLY